MSRTLSLHAAAAAGASRKAVAGLLAALLALACAGAGLGAPSWVDDPYDGRARARVIAAVGSGADRQSAANSARAEVAQILDARVEGSIETSARAEIRETGEGARSTVVEDIVENVAVRTDVGLRGSEIAERWKAGDGTRYALAVLDKARMRESLAADIAELDRTIADHLAEAASSAGALERARAYLQALPPAEKRNHLLGTYRVVGGRADPAVGGLTAAGIAGRARAALREVRIAVDARAVDLETGAAGAALPELRSELAARLSEMGLDVVSDPGADPTALVLAARIGVEVFDRGIPRHATYRWQSSFELRDGQRSLAASRATGDESHTVDATARQLALRRGRVALSQDLERQMAQYLSADASDPR
ncbi:MAG: LPP20 family lipoprotein [Myxococcota bacterium]